MATTLKIDEQYNVGKARYVVNYYTGDKHADGSDFYAIAIFRSRKAKEQFILELVARHAGRSV
jgi:hypothetical protein